MERVDHIDNRSLFLIDLDDRDLATFRDLLAAIADGDTPTAAGRVLLNRVVKQLDETLAETDERDETPAASLLLRAGWTRVPSGPVPWWRDPASGREHPEWRAAELAERDAQRERGQA